MLHGMGANMQTIKFGTGKLALGALAGIMLPIIGMPMLFGGVALKLAGLVFVIGGPLVSAASIKRLLGDGVALQYDALRVRVATSWSSESFRWTEVKGISRSQLVTRMWGVIPVSRKNFIDFKVQGGAFGTRTIRLAVSALDLKKRDVDSLVGQLQLMQAAQAGSTETLASLQASVTPPDRDPIEGAPRDEGFDADAALARYLANRPAPEPAASPATPRRPSFGRKIA